MSLINIHGDISRRARGLKFGPSLHLHQYFVYASSVRLHIWAGSSEPWLLANEISTKISCAGPIVHHQKVYQHLFQVMDKLSSTKNLQSIISIQSKSKFILRDCTVLSTPIKHFMINISSYG